MLIGGWAQDMETKESWQRPYSGIIRKWLLPHPLEEDIIVVDANYARANPEVANIGYLDACGTPTKN